MRRCTHKNIVCLYDHFTTTRHVYLVLELCRGGDLHNFIRYHSRLDESVTRRFLLQLEKGLQFLNEHHLLHRDIKPQNLLLTEFSSRATLKLADFGMARALAGASLATTHCGSPLYMAPEILRNQDYDAKADLWSVGCVVFQMLVGSPPFNGDCQSSLLRNIEREPLIFPSGIPFSDEMKAVLSLILRPDPTQRGSLKDLSEVCSTITVPPDETPESGHESEDRDKERDARSNKIGLTDRPVSRGDHMSSQMSGGRGRSQSQKVQTQSPSQLKGRDREQDETRSEADEELSPSRRRGSSEKVQRRNSDPLPKKLLDENLELYQNIEESAAMRDKDNRRTDAPPGHTARPNSSRPASVRPATATMVMGLGQHGHTHTHTHSSKSGQSPPKSPSIMSRSSAGQSHGQTVSPPLSGLPHTPPKSPNQMNLPMPMSPIGNVKTPCSSSGSIVFTFGAQQASRSSGSDGLDVVRRQALHSNEDLAVDGDGDGANSSGSDDDFVIVENTSSHPWRATNSGCSEQQQQLQKQKQNTGISSSVSATDRAIFVATVAQHCQRIAGIVVAVTVAGDTLVRDHLCPPSRSSEQAYAAWKERAKAARACCYSPSQSVPPHPLMCALAVYLRGLLLLKDVMQRALGLRVSEPEGSTHLEPIDKLLEELAVRFQSLVQRAEHCKKIVSEDPLYANSSQFRSVPADPLLIHAAVQLASEGTVHELLGDLIRACDSFQVARYIVEAVLITASDSSDRKQLLTLLKQITEKLEACEKSGSILGYGVPSTSLLLPSSTPPSLLSRCHLNEESKRIWSSSLGEL
eukprot:CAMPEP_0182419592 /NCGR_PEP_ID=MMETSP1167-20130531/4010_1 /TAXON_ID=2988 /ORGANISM="Mallomonas Sp, Strain CCMP3275" /LENGTH=804 /DNA_ID=CAMNT_0024594589 /DNA_START=427 /DNA_END=2841 /DNA_ORIENTATION=+